MEDTESTIEHEEEFPTGELLTPEPWEENGYWHLSYSSGITGVYHSQAAALKAIAEYNAALD